MKITNFNVENNLYLGSLSENFEIKDSHLETPLPSEIPFKECDKSQSVIQENFHSWADPFFLSAGNYVDAIREQLLIQTFVVPMRLIHNSSMLCDKTPLDVDFSCDLITNHPALNLIPEHEPQKPNALSNWIVVDFFRKANKNYRKISDQYKKAMRNWAAHIYQCNLSQYPLISHLYILHAFVSLLNNRWEDASNEIDRAIFHNPHDLQVYLIKFISDYRKNKNKFPDGYLEKICKLVEDYPLVDAIKATLLESLILGLLAQNKNTIPKTSCLSLLNTSQINGGDYTLCYKSKLQRKCFLLLLDAYDSKIQFLNNKEKLNVFEIIPQLFSKFALTVDSDPYWLQKFMEELNSLILLESVMDNWDYSYQMLDIFIFESLFILFQNIN